jgi:hypothetical protein
MSPFSLNSTRRGQGRGGGRPSRGDAIRAEADRFTADERQLKREAQDEPIRARVIAQTGRKDGLSTRAIARALSKRRSPLEQRLAVTTDPPVDLDNIPPIEVDYVSKPMTCTSNCRASLRTFGGRVRATALIPLIQAVVTRMIDKI